MKSAFKLWLATFLSFMLVACGGGGSISDTGEGGGGVNPPVDTITVTASIDRQEINAENPATITANVKGSLSGVKVGKLVTFKLNDDSMGTFTPATGTALTDSNGNATIQLATADKAGAGTVVASIDTGEESEPVGFVMKGDGGRSKGGEAQVSLALTDVNGLPIETISSTKPGKLVATVSGISKTVIVTFSSTLGDLPIKTAITDANGRASVDVYAGSQPGAAEATASLASGEDGKKVFVIGATNVQMGTAEGAFISSKASISATSVSAGGTVTVSVKLQDEQGNLFTEPVDVHFTSTCASQNPAEAELSSPVTAVGGFATSTYLAKGCVGDDNISVTANVGGKNLSATGVLNVLAADVGSIVFVSTSPEDISIKGTGGDESSVVKFKVLDTNSNPVANREVSFSLNTDAGGLTLSPLTATTNSQGIAQTVVTSGTVATSVRVTASITGTDPLIESQSSVLVISTGKPDQDSFSLSAEALNAEGWDRDGTEVKVTARLADAFNNPVPDGTAVYFTTEGGAIEPSCTTTNGACVVTWRSQNARPEGYVLGDADRPRPDLATDGGNFYGQKFGGRATITATAVGEESFPDSNGNGRFDAAEMTEFLNGTDVSGRGYDLDEAFGDFNEDGIFNPQQAGGDYDSGKNEELIDFNTNGVFDLADKKYNGVLCSIPAHAGCADGINDSQSLNVRASLVMVMSGSTAYAPPTKLVGFEDDYIGLVQDIDENGNPVFDVNNNPVMVPSYSDNSEGEENDGQIDIRGKGTASLIFSISDLHNQQMPAGSKVSFKVNPGSVVSTSEYTWPSSNYNGARQYKVTIKGSEQPEKGLFSVVVTTPNGIVTEVLTVPVEIH